MGGTKTAIVKEKIKERMVGEGAPAELVLVFPFFVLLLTLLDLGFPFLLLSFPSPKLTLPGRWVTTGGGLAFFAGKELGGG